MIMRVYIGYDKREHDAYVVCTRSLRAQQVKKLTRFVHIRPLEINELREKGLYRREYKIVANQRIDSVDNRPCSTDFTYTRFLVPTLNNFKDWAVFCDLDFLFRADILEIEKELDDRCAVMCVQHNYQPVTGIKMDGQLQAAYPRKNWSSFMAVNCGHPANKKLTPDLVNSSEGRWLHAFGWLKDSQIGELSLDWNYLVGHNTKTECPNPKAVHFTLGIPTMPGYAEQEYSNEWMELLNGFLN